MKTLLVEAESSAEHSWGNTAYVAAFFHFVCVQLKKLRKKLPDAGITNYIYPSYGLDCQLATA